MGHSSSPPLREITRKITEDLHCEIYFEIAPLLEEYWTGIPTVAAGLARALVRALPNQIKFFLGFEEINPDAVIEALERGTGLFLHHEFHGGQGKLGPVHRRQRTKTTIGIYPSVKSSRSLFDIECSIVHDISTLTTPHFHSQDNITHHTEALQQDIAGNDLTICVSAATAADLEAYLGTAPARMIVAHNGVAWRSEDLTNAERDIDPAAIEPYFMILGTREPRKNIGLVLDMLTMFPDLMISHRFIFTGMSGWLQEHQTIPPALAAALESGRIYFTGFISEAEKCKLLMAAEASIYPSLFEGFGLPVVESLSLGTPCIASFSSCIPEVGGAICSYFDPHSPLDLYRAIKQFLENSTKRDTKFRQMCKKSVEHLTWDKMAADILIALESTLRAKCIHQ